jgi:6-phosphogluconolactonase
VTALLEWVIRNDAAGAEEAAAEFIAARLGRAARRRGTATLAVSGGRSPWGMFARLAALDIDWSAVHLFQVDERIVPAGHEARNWRSLLANPLVHRIPPDHRHPMPVEMEDPELAAGRYAKTLAAWAGTPPQLDVVHLGLGEDGHTASLFAGDPLLQEQQRRAGVSGLHAGYRRLSLTLPVLNGARCVVWFVVGAARREALARLRAGDVSIPAARVQQERAVCFADREAAPEP